MNEDVLRSVFPGFEVLKISYVFINVYRRSTPTCVGPDDVTFVLVGIDGFLCSRKL